MEGFQVDLSGFLVFLVFVIPGVVARKARDAVTPRSLKTQGAVAELGDFVLDGVLVHLCLSFAFAISLWAVRTTFLDALAGDFAANPPSQVLFRHPRLTLSYFLLSLPAGYIFGFLRGWQILRQPLRTWLFSNRVTRPLLGKIGVTALLEEHPVWYSVFSEQGAGENVFVEVEMKEGHGFYSGLMKAYGILDDSEKSKDFYLIEPFFRRLPADPYESLSCDGVLLNFSDVASIKVKKEPFPE